MIEVRDELPQDRKAIYDVVSAAFGQSAEADLVDQLRDCGDCVIALVAEEDHLIVGHVLLSRMTAPFRALALAPVSVAPTRQGSGIGSTLIRTAIDRARGEEWEAIFVLGEPKYYERFGFDQQAGAGFTSPYAGSHFMMLKISTSLPTTGELRHAPAFSALE